MARWPGGREGKDAERERSSTVAERDSKTAIMNAFQKPRFSSSLLLGSVAFSFKEKFSPTDLVWSGLVSFRFGSSRFSFTLPVLTPLFVPCVNQCHCDGGFVVQM
jgi:hypothetical protein